MSADAQATLQQALTLGNLICLDTNCLLYYFEGKMPWAESLRPVFQAKDGGTIRLFTSSLTLAELLAKVDSSDQSAMLSAVRQYFDLVPVNDQIGINAAGIRRASIPANATKPAVKTPDAIEMATAAESQSLLFITNDEQLTRMPHSVKALYLKELVLDWLDEEFASCLAPNITATLTSAPFQSLNFSLSVDTAQDWMLLQNELNPDDFVRNAIILAALLKGTCAVVGLSHGLPKAEKVTGLRILSTSRPWIMPPVPSWVGQFTNKKHHWDDSTPTQFIQRWRDLIEVKDKIRIAQGTGERVMPFIVVHTSMLEAENEVNTTAPKDMLDHKKRQEILRRYLTPFKLVMPLLELDGVRLWKAEAQNAHEIDIGRFRQFFSYSENVIGGKEAGV